jgi:hypothetical protein
MNCDTIQSNVEIFYEGREISKEDEREMFDLLIVTIESQAASGTFDSVGTIESVELMSSTSTGSSGGSPARELVFPRVLLALFSLLSLPLWAI